MRFAAAVFSLLAIQAADSGESAPSGLQAAVEELRTAAGLWSVGADGHLWVMTGPAGGETRTTPDTPLVDGRSMRLRFTRFNVTPDRFDSRMELSFDGDESWTPGNHQVFVRAPAP